jgi:hypothetical protein
MATLKNTQITSNSGYIALPSGTGTQRPSPTTGMLRYNSSRSETEVYDGSKWISAQKKSERYSTSGLVCFIDAGNPQCYSGNGTTLTDLSGNSNNLTLPASGVTFNTNSGGSLYFDGTARANVAHHSSLDFTSTQQYTALIWVNPSLGGGTWHGLISKGNSQQYAATLNSPSKYIHYETNYSLGPINTPASSIEGSKWQHVVIRHDGSSKATFINTIRCSYVTGTVSSTTNTETLRFGEGNDGELLIGYLGAVMVYNRALSDEEIGNVFNEQRGRYGVDAPLGSAFNPADSAATIKAMNSNAPDGVYYINLPTAGASKTYCIMDSAYDGGGWMLTMKATRGTTFNYGASYWTTRNTLNPTNLHLDDGDAKYDAFNYFEGSDLMARWPDIGAGGSISGVGVWTWLEKSFNSGRSSARTNLVDFFSNAGTFESGDGGSYGGYFIKDAKTFSGWASGVFSSQVDIRFYGFNFRNNPLYFGASDAKVRWGFGWNENGEGLYSSPATLAVGPYRGSDDVSGGIGMDSRYGNYSGGDMIGCCQDTTGINRSARVEVYIR